MTRAINAFTVGGASFAVVYCAIRMQQQQMTPTWGVPLSVIGVALAAFGVWQYIHEEEK